MHRRSFIAGFALKVLVRYGVDAIVTVHLQVKRFFNPQQLGQRGPTLLHVRILQHKRRLEVLPIGNQRVVCVELLLDLIRLKYFFNTKHFLNLILHRQGILKIKRGMGPDTYPPMRLVLQNAGAKRRSLG